VWFFLASPVSAAADVTQARYMTPRQFLHSLKQASLTLHGGSDVLDEYLPVEKARDMIQNALANRGIVVRPNSPVALDVTLSHERRSTTNLDEPVVRHDYFLRLQFFARGAVLRSGKFHALSVAPASVWRATYILEPNEFQRVLLNDETATRLRQQFAQGIVDSLKTIDAITTVDTTPFPPHSWSDQEKTQGNADFARAMRTDMPMDSGLILDLDVEPKLEVTSEFKESECAGGPTLRDLWGHEFRQLKWTRQVAQPPLTVEHEFHCRTQKDSGAGLVKLGYSLLAMTSVTLGMDVLAADSEDKLANMSLGEVLSGALRNRKSACINSGFTTNLGVPTSMC